MNPFEIGDLVKNRNVMELKDENNKKHFFLCGTIFRVIGIDGAIIRVRDVDSNLSMSVLTSDIFPCEKSTSNYKGHKTSVIWAENGYISEVYDGLGSLVWNDHSFKSPESATDAARAFIDSQSLPGRGGTRPGAGRHPRPDDGRKMRSVSVWLNDEEHQAVKGLLSADERRSPLMKAIERIVI